MIFFPQVEPLSSVMCLEHRFLDYLDDEDRKIKLPSKKITFSLNFALTIIVNIKNFINISKVKRNK